MLIWLSRGILSFVKYGNYPRWRWSTGETGNGSGSKYYNIVKVSNENCFYLKAAKDNHVLITNKGDYFE